MPIGLHGLVQRQLYIYKNHQVAHLTLRILITDIWVITSVCQFFSVYYLTALHIFRYYSVPKDRMIAEFDRIWKKRLAAQSKLLSQKLLEQNEENNKNLCRI
jgi:hypothetical protein